jgi:hypothetical protein
MRPRFGQPTRILAGVLLLAGVGGCYAGLNSGPQTTPGAADNGPILLVIGLVYLAAGLGLWIESLWGRRLGAGLAAFVVVMDLLLGVRDGGLIVSAGMVVLFAVSAVRGFLDRPAIP